MGIGYNTSIVRDGLLLYVDAANPKSYPGSGSYLYDLTGNNFHINLYNSPTYNSQNKSFTFNATNQYGAANGSVPGSIAATVDNLNLANDTEKTIVAIFKPTGVGSTTGGIFDLGDSGSIGRHYGLRFAGSYTAYRAQFWSTPDYDFSYDGQGDFFITSVTYRTDKIGRTFINGALIGQDASAFSLLVSGARPFEIGRIYGSLFSGIEAQAFLIYNRGLTDAEIKFNFEALRGRYGI